MKNIPTKVNRYNVYNGLQRMFAVGDELSMPDFESISTTLSGAGILGEIDDPVVGSYGNMQMEIPMRIVDEEAASMVDTTKVVELTIRGAAQTLDSEGNIEFKSIRVVVRGRAAKLSLGKLKNGNPMDGGVTLNITYIMMEMDGVELVKLSKLTEQFEIMGVDQMATIKEMC